MKLLIAGLLAALVSPALAAEGIITCTSLDGIQTANITVDFDDGSSGINLITAVNRVDLHVDDRQMTTAEEDGHPGLLLTDPSFDFDSLEVLLENPQNIHIVADLQLSRAVSYVYPDEPENDAYLSAAGGTMAVQGSGAWVVRCEGW